MSRTEFLPVCHLASTVSVLGVDDYLNTLPAGFATGYRGAFVGLLGLLVEKFTRSDPPTTEAAALYQEATAIRGSLTVADWNDLALAKWAAAAPDSKDYFLTEVLRVAAHRDGSNKVDAASIDMVWLLCEAERTDPLLEEALKASGVSLGSIRFGNFPPGCAGFSLSSVSKPVSAAPPRKAIPTSATAGPSPAGHQLRQPPGFSVGSQFLPKVPRPAVVGLPQADLDGGTVKVGSTSFSISDAIKLRDGLTAAIVELLRPEEGYTWLDDTGDPQSRSILVDLDGQRAKGLPEVGGGFLQGEVIQIPAKGPDVNAGKYLGRLYNTVGGFTEFATDSGDMNTAKFKVSERVRSRDFSHT